MYPIYLIKYFFTVKNIQSNKLDTYNSSANSDIKYQNFKSSPIKIRATAEPGVDVRDQNFTLYRKQL